MIQENNLAYWSNAEDSFTYDDLYDYVSSSGKVYSELYTNSTVLFYKNLIKAICSNINLTLIDLTVANDESNSIGQMSPVVHQITNYNQLYNLIINSQSLITLYTSGTTGQPKSICHSVKNLIRNIKIEKRFQKNIWGLTYSPTHMAGLQVFFQALLNQNLMINLFEKSANEVSESINKFKITHLSATPTFYRLMLASQEKYTKIKQVSIGGEKSNAQLIHRIQQSFVNAKVRNIYASTEVGALFASGDSKFMIPDELKNLIKINENQLMVHESIIGKSSDINTQNGWYHTGDMVQSINEYEFEFISRSNEMINVGGNKVNPHEIEEMLLKINGINEAYVYSKPNSVLGNILCSDLMVAADGPSELEIKKSLALTLPSYKVPRMIYFKDKISMTKSGKINRSNHA